MMAEAEARRQGVAWRVFSRDGKKASRLEAKFVDDYPSPEFAKRHGIQMCIFPCGVEPGAPASRTDH